ncbi:POK18 protein, partial [Corythaixoides concolor]|nr:POK18 protein [Corythaixoides concolor]
LQRLLGTINWVCPLLDIDNTQLSPLFDMLKGKSSLNSPRRLTPEAQKALAQVELAIQSRQAYRQKENLEIMLMVINNVKQPLGLIAQWDEKQQNDPLILL